MPHEVKTSGSQLGLVSVIMPCYNAERFLREALESALLQTYPHTEIIVIDDGSTDRTAEIIRAYANRVTAEFGPNRGASATRNRGTALAHGEFIQYLDADDVLPSDAIEHRIAALRKSGADVAYSDWEKLIELERGVFEVREKIVRRIEDVHPLLHIALITDFWAPPAAVTYRRTLVEKIGGWKEWLPIIQDARFLQDAALVGGRFVYSPGLGGQYRVHRDTSLSRRGAAAFITDVFRNACDLQAIFEAKGTMNAEERRALARIYDYAARSLFFQDQAAFRDCVTRLYSVEPHFAAKWSKIASLAARLVGFGAAGSLLSLLSRLQQIVRRT